MSLETEMMGYIAVPNSGNWQNNWVFFDIKGSLFLDALLEMK